MSKKITAVIPALNEENTIGRIIQGIKKYTDEVVLVDDGSSDNTAAIARESGATVVSNNVNLGYDKSIDRGFSVAAQNGADVIFTMDADGQHIPDDIPMMVEPVLSGAADVVVGRRPYHARITEYLFGIVAKTKIGIDDPLCGFKVYSVKVYKDIGYFDRISSIGTQLLFNAKKKGYRIIQKDISLNKREDEPRFGRRIKANWKIFKAIIITLFY
jgi:glycosyltransferase involved in cell wall biosynthesis